MKKSHRMWVGVITLIGFFALAKMFADGQVTPELTIALIVNVIVLFWIAASLSDELFQNRLEAINKMEIPASVVPPAPADEKYKIKRERTRPKKAAKPEVKKMSAVEKIFTPHRPHKAA